ncbi:hypothetical protein RVR_8713 [Actinacidiphila reveromycinica]|uniref:SnoaL-like domain-containing protein n=1 Tax=Actinacidiphila reveromycinica TaxID=659352 RepID=A0A7U3VS35_9ACTN|nr:nuclear transport factor 2 family protein [Streptomyces sp. SN-593]BBB01345.1 hypothetical protein RVR_8713 [Streptomyces sp. SN-593]
MGSPSRPEGSEAVSLPAEDRAAIHELIAKYTVAEDSGQADDLAALFTEDGRFTNSKGVSVAGREELARHARKRWEKPAARDIVHLVGNVTVEATSDGARAESAAMSVLRHADGFTIRDLVSKVDELRREDGRWLFSSRTIVPTQR